MVPNALSMLVRRWCPWRPLAARLTVAPLPGRVLASRSSSTAWFAPSRPSSRLRPSAAHCPLTVHPGHPAFHLHRAHGALSILAGRFSSATLSAKVGSSVLAAGAAWQSAYRALLAGSTLLHGFLLPLLASGRRRKVPHACLHALGRPLQLLAHGVPLRWQASSSSSVQPRPQCSLAAVLVLLAVPFFFLTLVVHQAQSTRRARAHRPRCMPLLHW